VSLSSLVGGEKAAVLRVVAVCQINETLLNFLDIADEGSPQQ